MEEVSELLKTWELDTLIPEFNKKQITIQALSALTDADIKELIPLTGPRSLFMRCWRSWKAEFSSTVDLSLFESITKEVIVINEPLQEKENLHPNLTLLGESSQCMILEKLLVESLAGDSARNLLSAVIAKAILNENKNSPISGAIYYKWANYIKELFRGERTTTYYIPACTTANGIVLQAKGKLVNQVLKKRRHLQNLGALPMVNRKRSREESPTYTESNPSPRPIPDIFIGEEDNEEDIKDDILWLENSADPWYLVEEKWQRTQKIRAHFLYGSNDASIETYFGKYLALRQPHGYSLIYSQPGAYEPSIKNCESVQEETLQVVEQQATVQIITSVNSDIMNATKRKSMQGLRESTKRVRKSRKLIVPEGNTDGDSNQFEINNSITTKEATTDDNDANLRDGDSNNEVPRE
ncbi:unnamed protein product [Diatraea saccharalis]|uniref:Uncharacterized protein n=1 Tax=Diatraea saccharalis TaxID=40085 RepID=A0A9N9R9E5_9NEOP|nr:unnamed protein product [Diatraea saccharalis]